jgi:hypothetical protein
VERGVTMLIDAPTLAVSLVQQAKEKEKVYPED